MTPIQRSRECRMHGDRGHAARPPSQDFDCEDIVADVEARNAIAQIVGLEFYEEVPEPGD